MNWNAISTKSAGCKPRSRKVDPPAVDQRTAVACHLITIPWAPAIASHLSIERQYHLYWPEWWRSYTSV